MEEVDDYDATLNWAIQEETLRTTRGQGYGSFYLILVSILILMFCFLVLYYSNRNRTNKVNKGNELNESLNALDLIKDENNILFEEFSNVEDDDDLGDDGADDEGKEEKEDK